MKKSLFATNTRSHASSGASFARATSYLRQSCSLVSQYKKRPPCLSARHARETAGVAVDTRSGSCKKSVGIDQTSTGVALLDPYADTLNYVATSAAALARDPRTCGLSHLKALRELRRPSSRSMRTIPRVVLKIGSLGQCLRTQFLDR
jgi:hypothetical protein